MAERVTGFLKHWKKGGYWEAEVLTMRGVDHLEELYVAYGKTEEKAIERAEQAMKRLYWQPEGSWERGTP